MGKTRQYPKVAIVVVTYNNKNIINENLQSIQNLLYSNYDCILVDDCSNDGTCEYALTITPGIDINRFKPMKIRVKNKILFVANLKKAENYKGLEYLLLAIPIVKSGIKNIKLIVVGSGDYANYYKKLCQKLKIDRNVIFKGKLIDKNLVREYQQTNVLVLPSLFESCPTVLLEAMACEKPVIGTNICGIPYIIKNEENVLLFPPKDSKALAEAIITILNNPIFAKSMGGNGYKKVKENFLWDKQIEKTKKIIEESLGKK